jgi:nucleoside-diphosphate-sugar epimerase
VLTAAVHVENAAAAHLNALDHLAESSPAGGGKAFFITQDEPVRCWDWIFRVLDIAGVQPPRRRISLATAWRVGAAMEAIYRFARIRAEPPMTRFVAAQLARDHYFDITAAKEILGYRPAISTDQGLEQLKAAWNRG